MKKLSRSYWVLTAFCCLILQLKMCMSQEDETFETTTEAIGSSAPCKTTNGEVGICGPLSSCPSLSFDVEELANNSCHLDDSGTLGICCSDAVAESDPTDLLLPRTSDFTIKSALQAFSIDENVLNVSRKLASQQIEKVSQLEQRIVDKGLTADENTAEGIHNIINFAQPEALEAEAIGALNLEIARQLRTHALAHTTTTVRPFQLQATSKFNLTDLPGLNLTEPADMTEPEPVKARFPSRPPIPIPPVDEIRCPDSKYRTFNGICNNLEHKKWGSSHTAFTRLSAHTYADGLSEPRISISGKKLPSCRLVTTSIIQKRFQSVNDPNLNTLYMAFGQFVDHDLSQTPTKKLSENGRITVPSCCRQSANSLEKPHPECMPIDIPKDDPYYKDFNKECMEFVRSATAAVSSSGRREQQNQPTSYLDASHIYGNLERITINLRNHSQGTLRVSVFDQEFPPHQSNTSCKGSENMGLICIETGDSRASEQPLLAAFHIIFLREHNRIADRLAALNPEWDDETLFQEARRVLIAIYQQIIYNEFLPILLGHDHMNKFHLVLLRDGFREEYDPNVDPSILNEFAAAAFRFGHSLVQSAIHLISPNGKLQIQRLGDQFLKPFNTSLLDSYIRGAAIQFSQRMDKDIIATLTNRLFQGAGSHGLDLPAINCQRGRDHGIGSYSDLRNACLLEPVHSFEDLEKYMDSQVAKSFAQVYERVEDIDLFIGGIAERPVPGALVGPVFACIIGEQFKRLREGDRFWFEHGHEQFSFSEAQLSEIRKASIARLFCDNTEIDEIQPLVFFPSSKWNAIVSCKNSKAIPKVSLTPWKVEP